MSPLADVDDPVRMFALTNLIATIEHNMFRVATAKVVLLISLFHGMYKHCHYVSTTSGALTLAYYPQLWEIAVGHLTCVVNHKNPQIRAFGVGALLRLVLKVRPPGSPPVSWSVNGGAK